MAEKLPDHIDKQLIEFGTRGREAAAKGNLADAEREFLKGWNVIPEPRARWDRAPSLARAMVLFYRNNRDFAKADRWLAVARTLYDQSTAGLTTVNMLEASLRYE